MPNADMPLISSAKLRTISYRIATGLLQKGFSEETDRNVILMKHHTWPKEWVLKLN